MEPVHATRLSRATALALLVLSSAACSTLQEARPQAVGPAGPSGTAASDCRVIYDAGSSGTRLYVYRLTDAGWEEHEGDDRLPALADPVREIRGKTWSEVDDVVAEVVQALPAMLQDGPLDDGEPAWVAFDWRTECNLVSASVFATAGMRIAEQTQRERSAELWAKLNRELTGIVGAGVAVTTRTLSGFEEGLFTWLALAETAGTTDFGIAEMGGASAQVTYPCPDCDPGSDRVRTVTVRGEPLRMFSYSFLGLGTDEAPRSLGFPMSCRYGIGQLNPGWKVQHCRDRIDFTDEDGEIYDPYNFGGGAYGIDTQPPAEHAKVSKWFLTGAFPYMQEDDVDRCCVTAGDCYQPETACFRAVYLRKYLAALQLNDATPSRASWTKGANLCLAEDCLSPASPAPVCRWAEQGCLSN